MMVAYWDGEKILTTGGDILEGSVQDVTAKAVTTEENITLYVINEDYAIKWLYYLLSHGVPVADSPLTKNALTVLRGVNKKLYHITYKNKNGKKLRICLFENLISANQNDIIREFPDEDFEDAIVDTLRECENFGIHGITIGSEAMRHYRESMGAGRFAKTFPQIDKKVEHYLRTGYIGGYLYCKPGDYGETVDYDENSMYPSIMRDEYLPYGQPVAYDGEYKDDPKYPLHMDMLTFRADLKEDGYPWLTIPHTAIDFEYARVESTHGYITMCLSNVDQELLQENYDVSVYQRIQGWKFKQSNKNFVQWVDTWGGIKQRATGAKRAIVKHMTTSLVGKFGSVSRNVSLKPYIAYDRVMWRPEKSKPATLNRYLPVSIFINSYGRKRLISAIRKNKDRVIYANTDGFILKGLEKAEGVKEHPNKIGLWKREHEWKKLRILRLGLYQGERTDGSGYDIISSGLSRSDPIPWDDFWPEKTCIDDYGDEVVL